ncbi:MAG: nitroreductase family protein [Candidatus Nanohaloarchaea archaeon]
MSVFEAVKQLSSFRDCEEKVIPRKKIGKILEAGRQSPSPGNVHSIEFIVVEDEERKQFMARAAGDERIEGAPTTIVLLGDMDRMARKVGEKKCREACNSEIACAVQNMRLVAEEEGLASCWIGGFDEDAVAEQLEIPSGKQPLAIVILGYSDDRVQRGSKFGLNQIAHYDIYDNKIDSDFDNVEWDGIREEKEMYGRKLGSLRTKIESAIAKYL